MRQSEYTWCALRRCNPQKASHCCPDLILAVFRSLSYGKDWTAVGPLDYFLPTPTPDAPVRHMMSRDEWLHCSRPPREGPRRLMARGQRLLSGMNLYTGVFDPRDTNVQPEVWVTLFGGPLCILRIDPNFRSSRFPRSCRDEPSWRLCDQLNWTFDGIYSVHSMLWIVLGVHVDGLI